MSDFEFDDVDGHVVAAEVDMLRSDSDAAILILEGGDDMKLFLSFIDQSTCTIVISEGKANAIAAMNILLSDNIPGLICVIDRDYDDFLGINNQNSSVIVTEDHDIESMLLRSPALDRVMIELCSPTKAVSFAASGRNIRDILVSSCQDVGRLRLYSLLNNKNLRFKKLSYQYLDRRTLNVDISAMIQEVFNNTRLFENTSEARGYVNSWNSIDHDSWMMCCGHDLTFALARAFHHVIGSQNQANCTRDDVESRLRLAYSAADFRNTHIYRSISTWENCNRPYKVLA